MENYIALKIELKSQEQSDALVAYLSEAGFDGFEELSDRLIAYRTATEWNAQEVESYLKEYGYVYTIDLLEKTNWNQLWESNFEPVRIDDFVGIRADFHDPIIGVEHELIITPKMSFGTGHHATTRLMVQAMWSVIKPGDRVLDFGSGTGVLAILAKKLGAGETIGIDVEDWSVENAADNAWVNEVSDIRFICADRIEGHGTFDLILANINLNVLFDNMDMMAKSLKPEGVLLLSGILLEDLVEMDRSLEGVGLKRKSYQEEKGWISVQAAHSQPAV
jgi:ribosomal protein L11 methyltransferase